MPSLWQLPCCYSSIKSTAAYTKHRASLFLADRDIDGLLDLGKYPFCLFLAQLTLASLYPSTYGNESITKEIFIFRTHRS